MNVDAPRGLLCYFDELPDPRMNRLDDIIIIAICAVIRGANEWGQHVLGPSRAMREAGWTKQVATSIVIPAGVGHSALIISQERGGKMRTQPHVSTGRPATPGTYPLAEMPAPSVIPVQWGPKKQASAVLARLCVVLASVGLAIAGFGSWGMLMLMMVESNPDYVAPIVGGMLAMLCYVISSAFFIPAVVCGICNLSMRKPGKFAALAGLVISGLHVVVVAITLLYLL